MLMSFQWGFFSLCRPISIIPARSISKDLRNVDFSPQILHFLLHFKAFCVPWKMLIDDQKPLEVKRCYKNNQFRRSHTNLNSKSGKAMKDEPWTTQHNARKQKVMLEQSPP